MPLRDQRRPTIAGAALTPTGPGALYVGAIVIAAIYFGRELFVPLVLAVLLAFVLAPVLQLLRRARVPRVPAVLIVVVFAFSLIGGVGFLVGRQISQLADELPNYQTTIQQKMKSLRVGGEMLGRVTATIEELRGGLNRAEEPSARLPRPAPATPPSRTTPAPQETDPIGTLRALLEPLLAPLATGGIVVVFLIFVLLYREDLRDRFVRLAGSRDLHRTMTAMNDAAYRLSRYFLTQLLMNAAYGVFIASAMWIAGLPAPVLWGILAGLMRFVPFIGTVIALVPPVLLATAVMPGWSLAVTVLALFLVSEALMGQVVEPLLYGHSTGLSPISVVVSATFWTFMWGPIGLLLATPLTVCLVVLGRHVEALEFLDVMLGDTPPLQPEESFYQRSLAGDADSLVQQARQLLREEPLGAYYDTVALRGLVLAQSDAAREVLEPERLDDIHHHVEALLDDLAHHPAAQPANRDTGFAFAADWQAEGAVLLIGGRGQLDDLAAAMGAQLLRQLGFGAQAGNNALLGSGKEAAGLDAGRLRLVCLSVMEEGNSAASVRYFLRRIRKQAPDVPVALGLWCAGRDSRMLEELREDGAVETIVTSLREAVAFCQAVAAQPREEIAAQPREEVAGLPREQRPAPRDVHPSPTIVAPHGITPGGITPDGTPNSAQGAPA